MTPAVLKYRDRFRKPPQIGFNFGELTIDNFAGGGGASTGIEAALGRPVDFAINHDPVAVAMHEINFRKKSLTWFPCGGNLKS